MQLAAALRLTQSPCLALVGAGGKTTALFTLARQLPPPVFITTTTHLAIAQLGLADRHYPLETSADLSALEPDSLEGVIVFTGLEAENSRVSGPGGESLEGLRSLTESRHIPLLIEADGSRQKPLKAPAAHEPALPGFVDTVVVLAGLSALGKPINAETVHRPEIFTGLSGLKLGETVTGKAISNVLLHPQGGMKAVPPRARRVALLNQADSAELQAAAQEIAEDLLSRYHAVVVAQLGPVFLAAGEAPDKEEFLAATNRATVYAVHERVAGIVLAAGASVRFGRPKQLLDWQGRPFVWSVAQTALLAGLAPVVVVTGAHDDEVAQAVQDLPVEIVHNEDWNAGQSSSVRKGMEALPEETGAAVFLLSDQPQVPAFLIRSLVALHASTLSPVVAPLADGRRANPVLFDRRTFPDLFTLTGDVGGRAIFNKHPITWLEWHDPGVLIDVDTEADYQRLMELDA